MYKSISSRIRFFIWYNVGRWRYSNSFFLLYQKLFDKHLGVVSGKTDLVIEGFPRSGNTFLFSILSDFQQGSLSIAHHLHTLSQIKNAVAQKVPAIIMVRQPLDAIISFRVRNPNVSFSTLVNYYRDYHNFLLKMSHSESLLIIEFNRCILEPNEVIKSINDKFGFNFRGLSENQLKVDVINKIKEHDRFDNKSTHANSLTVSVPTKEKQKQKKSFVDELNRTLTPERKEELLSIFNRLTS